MFTYESHDGAVRMNFTACVKISCPVWAHYDRVAIRQDACDLWSVWLIPEHDIGNPVQFISGVYTEDAAEEAMHDLADTLGKFLRTH